VLLLLPFANLSSICSTQSLSHTTHKPQYSVEQPETTARMKEQTRIRTMGFPRKVEVKGLAHTATKTATAAAAASSAGAAAAGTQEAAGAAAGSSSSSSSGKKPGRPAVKASDMIDTLSSKVPLKWAASSVVVPGSSYTAAFGSNPGRSPQVGVYMCFLQGCTAFRV
jgi:regulator of protease activity HflC (stomatin/prohibitin superfamily)